MFVKLILSIKKVLMYIIDTPEKKNGLIISGNSKGIQNVQFEGNNAVLDRSNFSGQIKIGYATTLGYNNFFHGNISIGKYCQIGADVAIHTSNHPINYLSTYINKNLFNGELATLKETKKVQIGNDVWIGHGVIIIGNVTIGNGAIIAAGSVVTKDVMPYSIVAGNPAKLIKMRFSNEIILEIESLEWWNKTQDEIEKLKPLFFKNFSEKNSIYD